METIALQKYGFSANLPSFESVGGRRLRRPAVRTYGCMAGYGLSVNNYTGTATSYVARGDVLNTLFGEPGIGQVKYIKQQYCTTPVNLTAPAKAMSNIVNSIKNHLNGTVLMGLRKGEIEE